MNVILEIQKWYQQQCNGEWEHRQGINITTCDNPGWSVKINIADTPLEKKTFKTILINVPKEMLDQAMGLVKTPFMAASHTSEDWLICFVNGNVFNGAGDASKLQEILKIFLDWTKK